MRKTRDVQGHYTVTGPQGQQIPVLIQPTQAAASDTHEVVPRIQPSQLSVRLENVGQSMKWQARAENVNHFAMQAKEHEKQKRKDDNELDALAAAFNPGVTSRGSGSSTKMADDAMDMDKDKEDTTKENGRTGGDGKGSAVASGVQEST